MHLVRTEVGFGILLTLAGGPRQIISVSGLWLAYLLDGLIMAGTAGWTEVKLD